MKKGVALKLGIAAIAFILSIEPAAVMAMGDANGVASLGDYHAMTVRPDGSLWGWGDNYCGKIGEGTTVDKAKPVKIMDGVASVSAGANHTLAVKKNGELWAWGSNSNGQLGDGTRTDRHLPVKIMESVASASAGQWHSMAVKTDSTLWAWGDNGTGRLGNSESGGDYMVFDEGIDKTSPIKVMDDVESVSAGAFQSLALKTNGDLYTFGVNPEIHILSLERNKTNGVAPSKILENVVSMSAGQGFNLIVTSDGGLWGWGASLASQFAVDDSDYEWKVIRLMDGVAYACAGFNHSIVIKQDGSLWSWGFNKEGQVGDGTNERRSEPVKIMDDVVSASAGYKSTIAQKANGECWIWGYNLSGLLGNGKSHEANSLDFDPAVDSAFPIAISFGDSSFPVQTRPSASEIAPSPATAPLSAKPTASNVLVNSRRVEFDAYFINDSNFFKLRDLAYILNGTEKQFAVIWSDSEYAVFLIPGTPYEVVGGEMGVGSREAKTPSPASTAFLINGIPTMFEAYNIDGNNYFKLRDVAKALDFGIVWNEVENSIAIDTSAGYIEQP
ncbi:MAG: hypothetical protein LBU32_16895 [Clostridiales bacterium]|nr:hypothetical protein [Clostridiales bacterium]